MKMFFGLIFTFATLLLTDPVQAQNAIGAPNTLCNGIFPDGSEQIYTGVGYATNNEANPGLISLVVEPVNRAPGSTTLSGHFIVVGPTGNNTYVLDQVRSFCLDLADTRFSLLQLVADDVGSELILWLWGTDGVPQSSSRLIGYVTLKETQVVRSKVALWR